MHKKIPANPKWRSLAEAVAARRELRENNRKLVLTNGCFDLLHTGHLFYLREASRLGDVLWVLLNGDAGVRSLKGSGRPILPEAERAYALGALGFVDGIISFQTERLVREIELIRPDIYVKAGDYAIDSLHGEERRALEKGGAKIIFLPFLEGYGSTNLIDKIRGGVRPPIREKNS